MPFLTRWDIILSYIFCLLGYFQLVITGGFDTDVLCSYLKEEWNYLDQEVAVSDIPISDSIWNQLPNKIEEKKLAVHFVLTCFKFKC